MLQQSHGQFFQALAFFSRKCPLLRRITLTPRSWLPSQLSGTSGSCWRGGSSHSTYTDHKPLTTALVKSSEPWSARQQRLNLLLSCFAHSWQGQCGGQHPQLARVCSCFEGAHSKCPCTKHPWYKTSLVQNILAQNLPA